VIAFFPPYLTIEKPDTPIVRSRTDLSRKTGGAVLNGTHSRLIGWNAPNSVEKSLERNLREFNVNPGVYF
jgi:hypothetical protein